MMSPRVLSAELRKTAALPAALVAVGVVVVGSIAITVLNSFSVRNAIRSGRSELIASTSPVEVVFSVVPIGTVGAVVLGVVAVSSEYTANSSDAGGGRQITATLAATPRRLAVLAAKAHSVVLIVFATAVVTIPACLAVAHLVVGEAAPAADDLAEMVARSVGAALYWTLTGLIAVAVTVLTRNGIVPLVVLVANSSLLSVSLLLSNLIPLARYLPDLAGIRLFARDSIALDHPLDPLTGGLVMAAWAMGALVVSAVVFTRRDA
ncbi:ABC transporter permease [Saccharomonospora xinjiangensis]|uniref:ABC-2 family transporter protein n=1 Tax=Saccharomonospora xinjiangensis XJ-54 TaxID=882086 RepID=I0UWT7_9PSEU|nr:ABC transporter permease [Saccharomonospora xinjiangensis]EID52340.1 hypothetical protein SacxiDRAFT_0055 [Saccharomonospora xinjiangensis XJ-54]